MSASEILRAHIQALPEYLRQPWTADLVDPGSPTYGAVMEQQPAVDYIALLGPQVGEKLADLLDAICGMAEDWDETGSVAVEWARTVVAASLDLEAAITAGQT